MAEQKILFVNACVRRNSRTRFLAEQVIRQLNGTVGEVNPVAAAEPITSEEFIINRTEASGRKDFTDPAYAPARQFAEADTIVVAAPYWDLSFPAILKAYFDLPFENFDARYSTLQGFSVFPGFERYTEHGSADSYRHG